MQKIQHIKVNITMYHLTEKVLVTFDVIFFHITNSFFVLNNGTMNTLLGAVNITLL